MLVTGESLDHRFAAAMGQLLGPDFPKEIALAVSGGGDSMAMLALAHNWARVWGVGLSVVTVDHGLRDASADEAAMVAAECEALGWPHATLRWHWDGQGNLQDAARRARLELIDDWRGDIHHVLLAHTGDDVAETFLLRLARGSGVSGLAAMEAVRDVSGVGRESASPFRVIRPCLEMSREELRHYARTLHMPWVEDPSNEDPRFERAKARQMLPVLAELGLSAEGLRATADRMRRAEVALKARLLSVADDIVINGLEGVVQLDRSGFEAVERDTQLRLLAAACMWVSSAEYRPRAASLEAVLDTLLGGGAGTLHGAELRMQRDVVQVYREASAVRADPGHGLWDGRWRITGAGVEHYAVKPLGEAVKDCPEWRDTGQPRAALMASPAVWEGETLISAPLAGYNREFQAQIVTDFASFLLCH